MEFVFRGIPNDKDVNVIGEYKIPANLKIGFKIDNASPTAGALSNVVLF